MRVIQLRLSSRKRSEQILRKCTNKQCPELFVGTSAVDNNWCFVRVKSQLMTLDTSGQKQSAEQVEFHKTGHA